ncbi:MAG TPA: SET domain-containing protein-lysine N-methyltransferase [Anaerolineales bacterium]|nr:SET domain-containing protein-lysine N-methyltransferase [Anaerolineales bacterium]
MRNGVLEVRRSKIQGMGAFATNHIAKGTRIIEYTGERISQKEADRRYDDDGSEHPRVLLFSVDKRTVIDAGVGGNEAQYINHSCDPNCEAVTEKRRVFIDALRDIEPGEELLYDYHLTRQDDDPPDMEERYACHCGAPACRGTMLQPLEDKKPKKAR